MRQQLHRGSLLLLVALLSSMLAGCENGIISIGDEGSGIPVTETREVASFSSIEAGGALNLDVTVDPAALQSVEVVYDDNIIDRLTTEVRGDTLVVDLEGSINLTGNIDRVVTIVMNDLESIDASGAVDIELAGWVETYRLEASGASDVDAIDLLATDIAVDISGASTVDLSSTGTISGSVSGASSLFIHGEPQSVLVDSSGASTIDIQN